MKKTLLSILLSNFIFINNVFSDEITNNCQKQTDLSYYNFIALNISLKLDQQSVIDKMLFGKCIKPITPKDKGIMDGVTFSINSIDSYIKMKKSGANFDELNRYNMKFEDLLFSYYKPFIFQPDYAQFLKNRMTNSAKFAPREFVSPELVQKQEFKTWNSKDKYDELLKFVIDKDPTILNKTLIGNGLEMGITPLHWLAYNGNYEVFKYVFDKYKDNINLNITNQKGQTVIATLLNHYCVLDQQGLEGIVKIHDLLLANNVDLNKVFKVNHELNIKVMPQITYRDLLANYKIHGNQEVYQKILEQLQKYNPQFFDEFNQNSDPSLAVIEDSMKTGYCKSINELDYDYPDRGE